MYTTASVLFKTFAEAGITHAFVNWGNDHPAILEELERQRVEQGTTALQIVTCPNEMVALSAAQGFTQVTGRVSVVIVHVDVGTQVRATRDFRGVVSDARDRRLWQAQCITLIGDARLC